MMLQSGSNQPIIELKVLNMSQKQTVLFICQHNSGRSQIAEAYLRKIFGENNEDDDQQTRQATNIKNEPSIKESQTKIVKAETLATFDEESYEMNPH